MPELVETELDLIMLCDLESILTGSDWEVVFDQVYINPVEEHGPEGPWIYQVSSALLLALRGLSPDSLLDCARRWSDSDEWILRQDTPREKVAEVLKSLVVLAELAEQEGKEIFIWTEL